MEWQAVVLVMQILMLAVGWFLFQQAKGELSARAAETPVLGEVKALQRNIKQLLTDLDQTSGRASQHLETQCRQARELAAMLSDHIEALEALQNRCLSLPEPDTPATLPRLTMVTEPYLTDAQDAVHAVEEASRVRINSPEAPLTVQPSPLSSRDQRRARVFALADAGETSSAIARETGISEGEIETLLGLRLQRV